MPSRIIREGILTSARMATLDWASECFFRRLMSVVDDFGRYYADSGLLRAACYPRQLNKVSDSDIGKWMRCVAEAALVRVYPAEDGERYVEIINFGQQVRTKKSKFPDPLGTCVADAKHATADDCHPPSNAPVFVSVVGDVSEVVGEGDSVPAARTAARKRRLDVEALPEDWRTYCAEKLPISDADDLFARFRDHHTARGNSMLDWFAAWRTWVGNEIKFARPRQPVQAYPPGTTTERDRNRRLAAALTGYGDPGEIDAEPERKRLG